MSFKREKMKICVLGLGVIGLPTALLLAKNGFEVVGIDIDDRLVNLLKNGNIPFQEPGLKELFNETKGNFRVENTIENSDVFLIAVPTPLIKDLKVTDLNFVTSACEMVTAKLKKGNLVILESTVPPTTCERLVIPILESKGVKRDQFYFYYCPERAMPGNTLNEMINNDRSIGSLDDKSLEKIKTIYSTFVKGNIYFTDLITAEIVKIVENTYRDVNIALANELAKICEDYDTNVWDVIYLANKHPRVNILNPGPGVGGHCIPIVPWFLTDYSLHARLITTAREINDFMPNYVLELLNMMMKDNKNLTVTILGVSYKKNVDDARESPALKFIQLASNYGYIIKCHDPIVTHFRYPLHSLEESLKNSDCIVLFTDHDVFKKIDPSTLVLKSKNILDTRNCINPSEWIEAGFNVKILGNNKKNI